MTPNYQVGVDDAGAPLFLNDALTAQRKLNGIGPGTTPAAAKLIRDRWAAVQRFIGSATTNAAQMRAIVIRNFEIDDAARSGSFQVGREKFTPAEASNAIRNDRVSAPALVHLGTHFVLALLEATQLGPKGA
jgi:hypothetical protein